MIVYSDTSVFNVKAQTMVNTVNCVGIMGAGLALEFNLRYPKMYDDYLERCRQKEVVIGKPYLYKAYETAWIMNFPTKVHWKYNSKIEWIEQGLEYFVKNYEQLGIISVAFPKLGCDMGCDKGNLDWRDVKIITEKYLNSINIDTYICMDKERKATGTEGFMVDMINNAQDRFWIPKLRIKNNIADKIINALPIYRFRELMKIKGVGKQTYGKIFKLLYSKAVPSCPELT